MALYIGNKKFDGIITSHNTDIYTNFAKNKLAGFKQRLLLILLMVKQLI